MARRRSQEARAQGPVPGIYPISTGKVELREDPYSRGAFEVLVNGVPSSHICEDPEVLEYEYMRWIAAGVEAHVSAHLDPAKLRITHLGGGACSLARYFAHRYGQSRNTVVELDGELTRLVREWFDLPRAPRLKIRVGDAREVTDTFVPASRDVIIRDVFAGALTPSNLATLEFYRQVHRSLAPKGLYVANCGDHPDLTLAKRELKGMGEVFAHVAAIADPAMFKGRRYGNMILLGSDAPLPAAGSPEESALTRVLLGGAVPAQYKGAAWARRFSEGAQPLIDVPTPESTV